MISRGRLLSIALAAMLFGALLGYLFSGTPVYSQGDARYFPETQHWVRGRFLQYWNEHGGLAQQGYPLTEEFQEVSTQDGQLYTVQYFERAVFELHPENAPPNDVLLSLLGSFELDRRYPNGNPAAVPVGPGDTVPQVTATAVAVGNPIVGQVLELQGGLDDSQLRLTVVAAEETQLIPAGQFREERRAGGKFVVLTVDVANIGSEPDLIGFFQPHLLDSAGRRFSLAEYGVQASAAAYYETKDYLVTIQPGLSERVVLVYDVATDAANYRLVQ